MRNLILALLVVTLVAGSAFAQTSTSTATPTNTPTNTPTPTLANKVPEGETDFGAFQHGSFRVATPVCPTPNSQTIIIPGLKIGDLITVQPPDGYRGGVSTRVLTNNTLRVNMACTTAGGGDWEYVWFSRTQNKCNGAGNCKAASTVTPTPTATNTPA